MQNIFDVIVVGLGAHGSSAISHLSQTGLSVCGIDRFVPPHANGSSHGESRIIRQAYHESPMYVPLIKEAYKLWHELEAVSGKQLYLKTGGLLMGAASSTVVAGAKLSADEYAIPYEYLNSKQIAARFPALKPSEDTVAVLEHEAGILFPAECIKANLELANKNGALLLFGEVVQSINSTNNSIEVVTNKNSFHAKKIIVSAGAWLNKLMPALQLPLTVKRQPLFWFKTIDATQQALAQPGKLPIYIWEYLPGRMFYGFPDLGNGMKSAPHHEGSTIDPDALTKVVSEDETHAMQHIVDTHFNIKTTFNTSDVCMYTNTPDEHFIIDFHPFNKNIIIASPCSGHGFKFSSAIGKILCDMAIEKPLPVDITPFSIKRFEH